MGELERLSEEAYENKKVYNREYKKMYREKFNLRKFVVDIPDEDYTEILNFIHNNNMTRKDFIYYAYNKLKEEKELN